MSNLIKGDDINLKELLFILWKSKWIFIGITFVFAAASVYVSVSLPNVYQSNVVLYPQKDSSSGGVSGLGGQLGGLASLAGVNLQNNDKTDLAIEILKSRKFIDQFIVDHDLSVNILAAKEWSKGENKVVINPDIYDERNKVWLKTFSDIESDTPSKQELYKKFRELLNVTRLKEAGLVRISFEHVSPYVAKEIVDNLVIAINNVMKEEVIDSSEKSIAFLSAQLSKTDISNIQSVLYELIEDQAKSRMFAEVRDEYIFKTIDPAIVPEKKSSPNRALICIIGTFLGALLAFIIVVVSYFVKNEHKS
ncbi:Wzz/FepE/Etk N-terminal domain-containing protein [Pseudoalteromonas umbrosa]|uniref:Wzz/FepE/Etk N-terminal domain-containing protein n=1 Tax=Pseudoalteromonas umbrosa TaxID=3048489 RepID=UPI0024C2A5EF|nr:Wzz/FepE/Etk N-terminal domain-containing protein [Pseudoalteromonas sp. B95]MDK1289590.1 Wzz/FepE/Etk N-terminal domain-containing protein [Pseudoalteromonas sp. B95]